MKAFGIILFLFAAGLAAAQNYKPLAYTPPKEAHRKDSVQRKIFFGVSLQQYWGKFLDSNYPKPVFWKPCLGISARIEYYPVPWIGVGVGVGIQQRGTGLINPDKSGTSFGASGNPSETDSTHLERIRSATLEMPMTLLARSPFEIVKNVRLSGSLGIVFLRVVSVQDVWLSPADGNHKKTDISDQFNSNGLGFFASAGPEICADKTRFQLHFVYSKSVSNIYKTDYHAKWGTMGIRLAWLF